MFVCVWVSFYVRISSLANLDGAFLLFVLLFFLHLLIVFLFYRSRFGSQVRLNFEQLLWVIVIINLFWWSLDCLDCLFFHLRNRKKTFSNFILTLYTTPTVSLTFVICAHKNGSKKKQFWPWTTSLDDRCRRLWFVLSLSFFSLFPCLCMLGKQKRTMKICTIFCNYIRFHVISFNLQNDFFCPVFQKNKTRTKKTKKKTKKVIYFSFKK